MTIEKYRRWLKKALGAVLGVLMLLLVGLTGWAALSRRLPGGQPEGIYEFIVLLCIWTVFLGAAYAEWEGQSIYAGEPYQPSGRRGRDALHGFGAAVMAIVAWIAVFWQGLEFMRWQDDGQRVSVQLGIPLSVFTLSMLTAAVILTVLAVADLWRTFRNVRSSR